MAIAGMKEQISADSKTVQEGRGKEFSGSARVHVYMSVFTVMNLAGVSKRNLPQVGSTAGLPLMS